MLSFLRQTSPVRLAIFLLFALTCYRLWFITQMQLVPDEAYYWLWSKHLAASYRDKGPGIAWTIALGTKLFGNTVFGIRFFAVMLSTATGALIFLLARRLYDDRVALWCLLMAAVMPMMAVGSILMTIDSLSVFFWALAHPDFLEGHSSRQSLRLVLAGTGHRRGLSRQIHQRRAARLHRLFSVVVEGTSAAAVQPANVCAVRRVRREHPADFLVEHPDRLGSRHRAALAQRRDEHV